MSDNNSKWLSLISCTCNLVIGLVLQIACSAKSNHPHDDSEDSSSDTDSDSDSDVDSDADSDADTNTDTNTATDPDVGKDCSTIQWGAGCVPGEIVSHLQFSGFADNDGDHIVEQVETAIHLEDICNTGKKSLVIFIADGSCYTCTLWSTEISNSTLIDDIRNANGLVLTFCTFNKGLQEVETSQAYEYMQQFYEADYISGHLIPCDWTLDGSHYFPTNLVIDLDTMEVIDRGIPSANVDGGSPVDIDRILDLVNQAND